MKDRLYSLVDSFLINIHIKKEHTQDSKSLSDVQPREYSDQMHYDPNEYLGRSQVIQRKNSYNPNIEYKELSYIEFMKLKAKIKANPNYIKNFSKIELNKYNIQVADRILSNDRLFNNENLMQFAYNIINDTNSPEQAKARCNIIDKILSDERFLNNEKLMDYAGVFINFTSDLETAKAKCNIIDKVVSDERLINNEKFMNDICDIIYSINTPEEA